MAELYMLTEHSDFMMSFVFITDKNRVIIIDGGRPSDMEHLFEIVGKREIAAWILTHPHFDHIWGFNYLIENGFDTSRIEKVYYNFPSKEFVLECEPEFVTEKTPCSVAKFYEILPLIKEKAVIVAPDMKIDIDGLVLEFLFCGEERYKYPKPNMAVNESSIVFKISAEGMNSVLFLGDLGPEGGKDLLKNAGDKLLSDIVQMSHHGHSGVKEDVYKKIAPKACMWCCPDWLYEEKDVEFEPDLWGTMHQRKWMEKLGVVKHYVTKDGTQKIELYNNSEK